MSEDELIITVPDITLPNSPKISVPEFSPNIIPLESNEFESSKEVSFSDADSNEDPSILSTIFSKFSLKNGDVIAHIIADVILFYIFFQFVRNQYTVTFYKIQDLIDEIKLFKTKYGIKNKKKLRM
jgi:hypothetical protein